MTPSVVIELLRGPHGEYRRPCPECDRGPRDVAFSVRVDDQGACWHCFRCGCSGAVGHAESQVRTRPVASPRDALRRVWTEGMPVHIAEPTRGYLLARGLGNVLAHPPEVLRCHPALEYFGDDGHRIYPALIAKVQDRTGRPVSIHRTYLQGTGKAPVSTPKKLMRPAERGACGRAAIRLYPISPDGVLAVAEGIESALSYWVLKRIPVWSCISAGGLERFWIPEGVRELHIIEDLDPSGVGQHAAMSLFKRAASRWRRAVYVSPQMFGNEGAQIDRQHLTRSLDMNDVLRGLS